MAKVKLSELEGSLIKFSGKLSFKEAQQESAYTGENKGKIYFTSNGIVVGGNVVADVTPIAPVLTDASTSSLTVPSMSATVSGINKKIDRIVFGYDSSIKMWYDSSGNLQTSEPYLVAGDSTQDFQIYTTYNNYGIAENTINLPKGNIKDYGLVKMRRLSTIGNILNAIKNGSKADEPSYDFYASARDVYEALEKKANLSDITSAINYIGKADSSITYKYNNQEYHDTDFSKGIDSSVVIVEGEQITAKAGDLVINVEYYEEDSNNDGVTEMIANYVEYIFNGKTWSVAGYLSFTQEDKNKLNEVYNMLIWD